MIVEALKAILVTAQKNQAIPMPAIRDLLNRLVQHRDEFDSDSIKSLSAFLVSLHQINKQVLDQGSHGLYNQNLVLLNEFTDAFMNLYDATVSEQYGLQVLSLESQIGALTPGLSAVIQNSRKNLNGDDAAFLMGRGDGNCASRAIIQSLLVRGLTLDQKGRAIQFLRKIYDAQQKEMAKRSNMNFDLMDFETFILAYQNVSLDRLADFQKQFFPLPGQADKVPPGDRLIHFLSGCLRFDMAQFRSPALNVAIGDLYPDIWNLGEEIDLAYCMEYFPAQDLQLSTSRVIEARDEVSGLMRPVALVFDPNYCSVKKPNALALDINWRRPHFDVRLMDSIDGEAYREYCQHHPAPLNRKPEPLAQEKAERKLYRKNPRERAIDALLKILDQYIEHRRGDDPRGHERPYYWNGLFSFFPGSKSFDQKMQAVAALKSALTEGKEISDADLDVLRNGELGRRLRQFIRNDKYELKKSASLILGAQSSGTRIRDFIADLNTYNRDVMPKAPDPN